MFVVLKRKVFEDYKSFAYEIEDKFGEVINKDDYGSVSVIANYYDAKEIVKELVCLGYDIASINIHVPEYEGYDGEYVVTLSMIDGVWCEPFKRENGYFTDESSATYIFDDCSSACIKYCEANELYEVAVGEDYEDTELDNNDGKSESVYVSKSKEDKPLGFSKSWNEFQNGIESYASYSFYSSDEDILRDMASIFGIEL